MKKGSPFRIWRKRKRGGVTHLQYTPFIGEKESAHFFLYRWHHHHHLLERHLGRYLHFLLWIKHNTCPESDKEGPRSSLDKAAADDDSARIDAEILAMLGKTAHTFLNVQKERRSVRTHTHTHTITSQASPTLTD